MKIDKVELVTKREIPIKGEPDELANPFFRLKDENGITLHVPLDPANAQYQEIAEWHKKQNNKPFKFEFESTPNLQVDE